MSTLNSINLGELFRELRLARGLKMKDVIGENLSQSQLSKFENGQTMFSADKLITAVLSIHMSLAEFEHAYNQYADSSFFVLANLISDLHTSKDINGLKKLLNNYDETCETFDTYNKLNRLVIKCAINDIDPSYAISETDIELITNYLFEIENWTEYELFVFGNTLHVLSNENLIFLSKAFIERDSQYLSIPTNKHRTQVVLLNIILVLLDRGQQYYADYFMQHLEKIINHQDMFVKTVLLFLRKILAYYDGKACDINDIENYIEYVRLLGQDEVAIFLQETADRLLGAFKAE